MALARTTSPGGGDELDRPEAVHREAVLAHEPAEAAAEGESPDARRRDDAPGAGQAVELGLAVVVAPGRPTLGPRPVAARVDVHAAHGGEVDHEAAVTDRVAGHIVAPAADGDLEAAVTGEAHRRLDIGGALAADHQGGPAVDQPVVDPPGVLVGRVGRREDGAGDLRAKGIGWMGGGGHRGAPSRARLGIGSIGEC